MENKSDTETLYIAGLYRVGKDLLQQSLYLNGYGKEALIARLQNELVDPGNPTN